MQFDVLSLQRWRIRITPTPGNVSADRSTRNERYIARYVGSTGPQGHLIRICRSPKGQGSLDSRDGCSRSPDGIEAGSRMLDGRKRVNGSNHHDVILLATVPVQTGALQGRVVAKPSRRVLIQITRRQPTRSRLHHRDRRPFCRRTRKPLGSWPPHLPFRLPLPLKITMLQRHQRLSMQPKQSSGPCTPCSRSIPRVCTRISRRR